MSFNGMLLPAHVFKGKRSSTTTTEAFYQKPKQIRYCRHLNDSHNNPVIKGTSEYEDKENDEPPQLDYYEPIIEVEEDKRNNETAKIDYYEQKSNPVRIYPQAAIRCHLCPSFQGYIHSERLHAICYDLHRRGRTILDAYPSFREIFSTKNQIILDVVEGRLPLLHLKKKYGLSVGEAKRRAGFPENMKHSRVFELFRKSKIKKHRDAIINKMSINGVIFRDEPIKKFSRFSPMLEQEAVDLANDIDELNRKYLPVKELGEEMLQKLIDNGNTLDDCEKKLKRTITIMKQVIKTMSARQPSVTGFDEKIKENSLDLPYHHFSTATHGFGHPSSLSHYQSQLAVAEYAVHLCIEFKNGYYPTEPVEEETPDEYPFEIMSDIEYFNMKGLQLYEKLKPFGEEYLQKKIREWKANPRNTGVSDVEEVYDEQHAVEGYQYVDEQEQQVVDRQDYQLQYVNYVEGNPMNEPNMDEGEQQIVYNEYQPNQYFHDPQLIDHYHAQNHHQVIPEQHQQLQLNVFHQHGNFQNVYNEQQMMYYDESQQGYVRYVDGNGNPMNFVNVPVYEQPEEEQDFIAELEHFDN